MTNKKSPADEYTLLVITDTVLNIKVPLIWTRKKRKQKNVETFSQSVFFEHHKICNNVVTFAKNVPKGFEYFDKYLQKNNNIRTKDIGHVDITQ